MKSNKEIALYFGGAILVGAIGFFVYSFFQKKVVEIPYQDESQPSKDYSSVFSQVNTDFDPIIKPSLIN